MAGHLQNVFLQDTEIRIDYPDRSRIATCEYVDDYHVRIDGEIYHLCQFAEIMEHSGGRVSQVSEEGFYGRKEKHPFSV